MLGIRFENPETGFKVLTIRTGKGKKLTVCGVLPDMYPGQCAAFCGNYSRHQDFGEQFHAVSATISLPGTLEGLRSFLVSCVGGIGPKNAAAIVSFFKEKTIEVLDNDPGRLTEVPGIGAKRAAELSRVWKENSLRRDGMIFLQSLGLTPAYCAKLFRRYGDDAPETVRKNPYQLAYDIDGIGFSRADAIASRLGTAADSEARLQAAAVYAVNTLAAGGHVGVPHGLLVAEISRLADVREESAASGIDSAVRRGLLRCDLQLVYLPYLLKAEKELPQMVAAIAAAKKFSGQKLRNTGGTGIVLAEKQLAAVNAVAASPLSIITGGPGVGKTTVIGEIVARAAAAGVRVLLAAPTGRAAKRLSAAAGREAQTLHRLLQYDPVANKFNCGSENPVNADLLIVDEVSMLDIQLCHALFAALRPGMSLVLVGDRDQLPPVGPGSVLQDFLASGMFAVTVLDKIFRQASGSSIVSGAHAVNRGDMPEFPESRNGRLVDFYWIEQPDAQLAQDTVARLVTDRIPRRFGFDPVRDIQVLTPMNKGVCGTAGLNEYLGAKLNGGAMTPGFSHGSREFRRGDKVMQTANNYDKNVFNGDIGIIYEIYNSKKQFFIRFDDGRETVYSFEEASQLVRAYAVTVHKSQGCEFPAVVLVLHDSHYLMLQRKLLYTAMTRAKKLLIIVGSRKALQTAIRNTRQEIRHSKLSERLKSAANRFF